MAVAPHLKAVLHSLRHPPSAYLLTVVSNLSQVSVTLGGLPLTPAYMRQVAFLLAMVADGITENTGWGIVPVFPTTHARFAQYKHTFTWRCNNCFDGHRSPFDFSRVSSGHLHALCQLNGLGLGQLRLCQKSTLNTLITKAAYQLVSQGVIQIPFKFAWCHQSAQFWIVVSGRLAWLLVLTMEMELLYDYHRLWLKMLREHRH